MFERSPLGYLTFTTGNTTITFDLDGAVTDAGSVIPVEVVGGGKGRIDFQLSAREMEVLGQRMVEEAQKAKRRGDWSEAA